MAFEAPVVRLVNLLIEGALAAEASDVHIEPFEDSLRVRYRIDGLLYDQEAPPRRLQAALTSRIKIMAELNIAERRLPQDGRIRVTAPGGRRVDIRVSTVPTIHGESIVMRLLDRSSVFLPFDRLASRRHRAASRALIHRRTASCSSRGPRDRARPPRSTRRSTRSTGRISRSSRSRIRSSTSSRASTRSRSGPGSGSRSRPGCATSCGRTRT
jgi:hypothetical protein